MTTINESGIYPVGNRVLILPENVDKETDWGFQYLDSTVDQVGQASVGGRVIAHGLDCWTDFERPFAKVGERVLFAKYHGLTVPGKDGKEYRVMNDVDITAVLEEDVDVMRELKPREVGALHKKEA